MLVPQLDEYAKKYQHIKFDRHDGILQITLHTEQKDLVWGFLPHQELGYCFGDIGSDPENKVIIFTGSGETFIHKEDLSGSSIDAKAWAEHVLPDAKRLLKRLATFRVRSSRGRLRSGLSADRPTHPRKTLSRCHWRAAWLGLLEAYAGSWASSRC